MITFSHMWSSSDHGVTREEIADLERRAFGLLLENGYFLSPELSSCRKEIFRKSDGGRIVLDFQLHGTKSRFSPYREMEDGEVMYLGTYVPSLRPNYSNPGSVDAPFPLSGAETRNSAIWEINFLEGIFEADENLIREIYDISGHELATMAPENYGG